MNKLMSGIVQVPLILALSSLTSALHAHPFHISVAEIEFNTNTNRFEASLKLHALDIEQALAKKNKRRINIEKDKDSKELLESYLEEHFFLTKAENLHRDSEDQVRSEINEGEAPRSRLHFVGSELETTWLWLYFELEFPEGIAEPTQELALVNSVLLDVTQGQINTLTVRRQGAKQSFKTTIKQPWIVLPSLSPE